MNADGRFETLKKTFFSSNGKKHVSTEKIKIAVTRAVYVHFSLSTEEGTLEISIQFMTNYLNFVNANQCFLT